MSSLTQLMAALRHAKVRVWVEEDQLRYQAPRGSLTPDLLAELRSRKHEIVELVRQAGAGYAPLVPVPRDIELPISLAQHRLWLMDQTAGENATYNIPLALRLKGDLVVDALRRSFDVILRRHEALRTAFIPAGQTARSAVALECRLPWRVVDLRHLPVNDRLAEVHRQAREEALRHFDLANAPLIRFVLWQMATGDHVLMITVHHIVCDGRSVEILAGELSTLYEGFSEDNTPELPALPIQFADFAWHQRRLLSDAVFQSQATYWQQQLAGLPPLLEIPADRPRPSQFSSDGATLRSVLPHELVFRIRELARESGTTAYVVLLAGAATLLARYTGRQDIPIACPATHRTRPELEAVVGFFVNTLALRLDLEGQPSFRQLLRHAQTVLADALANQDIPFEKVVESIRVERDPSYPPLVQCSIGMLDQKKMQPSLGAIEVEPFDFGNPIARFDLSMEMYESQHGIDICWIHSIRLFDTATIAQMARHLQTILDRATLDPDQSVFELDMLDPDERRQLIEDFNDTERAYPSEATIAELFERQVDATPGRVAAQFGEMQLTYLDLNRRANQVAWKLRSLGAAEGSVVALALDRSLELPIAMLGVLKAGAAFLPLDPDEPLERIDYVLNEVQPVVMLSLRHLAERLPSSINNVLYLDSEWSGIHHHSTENPIRKTSADQLAYIMYTSGSTGRPKGVCIPHRGVVRLIKEANFVSLSAGDTILQLAPVTFDASTFEIWGALLNGGRLAIMSPEMPTLEALGQALRKHGVTTLWLTAGLFHLMVDERLDDLLNVKQILAGGDVLSPDHVRRLLKAADGRVVLINGYGPTESTTFACCHAMTVTGDIGATVPIGRPISNTRVYVLDSGGSPVPIGVQGELHIGGDGLASGYLNAVDLTAKKFIPDPFDLRPGRRMYRTGDRARWRTDGTLEFLGRRDDQVKLRGFRIELGEIEAALMQHPAIHLAAVAAVEDGLQKYLAAYVTPSAGAPTLGEVQKFLASRLPGYMRIETLRSLDSLPLTRNGKVDRIALRRIEGERRTAIYEPPEGEIEARLAQIWSTVLNIEQVGRRDRFFELGGHSLSAAQIIARTQDVFDVLLPIRVLFDNGTIAAIASELTHHPQALRALEIVKLRAEIDKMDSAQIQELMNQKCAEVSFH